MSSKELLEHLQALKIPAKNHASTLVEAYVDKIRKDLAPVIAERQAQIESQREKEEAALEAKRQEADKAQLKVEQAESVQAQVRAKEDAERKQREDEERKQRELEETARKEAEIKAAEEAARLATETALQEAQETERYRRMAKEAEATQHTPAASIIAEAAKMAAASGPANKQKKKKTKKPTGKREQTEPRVSSQQSPQAPTPGKEATVASGATVAVFAQAIGISATEIIRRLMMLGEPLTVNQPISHEVMEILADDMGVKLTIQRPEEEAAMVFHDEPEDLKPRPPVVTVMGHVDHGKTSLLDAIRETGVAATEAGGITQHIGASIAYHNGKRITFIDTPGHEAFTAMRARGANATDVVVLVVAADDGVMPQTIEAIHHARAAGVPIVVAINKIDKDGANPDRVRQELVEHEVVPEEWGGKNIFVNVSARKRIGIDDLLEMILLQADILELKANPDTTASGVVVEAKLDKGRGPVATVLVQRGTLRVGDSLVAGTSHGRVRALTDPHGVAVVTAGPADPVEIQGLSSVPSAGDDFRVFADERDARHLAEERALKQRLLAQEHKTHVTLDDLFARIQEGELKDLNLVVKADVQGSIEALKDALDKMDRSEVRINVIHSGVGGITETDISLADASDAIVIGFNVRPQPKARDLAERTKVDVRLYRVIYKAIEDINAARVGMLAPTFEEHDTAHIEIRSLFKVPKFGVIAGCYVQSGEVSRDDQVRLVRDGTVTWEGKMASLRRFKDDAKSVKAGYECGIGLVGFQDLKEGDVLETFRTIEVAREE